MKSIAIFITTLCQLAALELRLYALNITIAGRDDCLACVRDPVRRAGMILLQDIARAEVRALERQTRQVIDRLDLHLEIAR
jgi:hypothetical protein